MNVVIFITVSAKEEAERIATKLVEEKLAACVNIVGNIDSVFWWEGKVDRAKELLLVVKSTAEKVDEIIAAVKSLHSYEVPEIIALPIVAGFKPYLNWINESVRKPR
ncbi:MAG: divalent-cation tolerance protein CutA [Candidatus Omnitrophota bacterium]|nr:divalent-cation tolerance protein CutA [Candidatus Omnitrophota bacterium]